MEQQHLSIFYFNNHNNNDVALNIFIIHMVNVQLSLMHFFNKLPTGGTSNYKTRYYIKIIIFSIFILLLINNIIISNL